MVTDLYEPETKYFATCKKWLAKDEGDGQISRDLMLYKDAAGARPSEIDMRKYHLFGLSFSPRQSISCNSFYWEQNGRWN